QSLQVALRELIQSLVRNVPVMDLYNLDETGLFPLTVPWRTYAGARLHGGRTSKERVT
ncbi:hypothetical protein BC828DRAFT_336414, partial [Blastocladiella britannica]